LLQNLSEKENSTTSYSFIQKYNSLKAQDHSASNVLYEFLKNKHLNKDVNKRASNDSTFLSKDVKNEFIGKKAVSKGYIDLKEL
jgi:hypothetical protein